MDDLPKSLRDANERLRRHALLASPHMAPLFAHVTALRIHKGPNYRIPDFDPLDGGVQAKILILLEAPGAKAIETGFVSRNNPDTTAKNVFESFREAGIDRMDTVLWNVIPWYIGKEGRIRSGTTSDLADARPHTRELIRLLPCLEVVVLMGRKASQAFRALNLETTAQVFETLHPSPKVFGTRKTARDEIATTLADAKRAMLVRPRNG